MAGQMQIGKNLQIRLVSVCLCLTHHPLIKDGSRIIRFLLSCNLAPSSPLPAGEAERRKKKIEKVCEHLFLLPRRLLARSYDVFR
jgi:hypothetical protein